MLVIVVSWSLLCDRKTINLQVYISDSVFFRYDVYLLEHASPDLVIPYGGLISFQTVFKGQLNLESSITYASRSMPCPWTYAWLMS